MKTMKEKDAFIKFLAMSLVFMLLVNLMMVFRGRYSMAPATAKEAVDLAFTEPVTNGDELETILVGRSTAGKIAAFDLYLGFNHKDWAFIKAEPGGLLPEAIVLRQETDHQTGLIRLAVFTMTPTGETGNLLKLSFLKINPEADSFLLELREGQGNGNKVTVSGKRSNLLGMSEKLRYSLVE